MKKISWVKVNSILWVANNFAMAKQVLEKEYKIDFPIYRKRSKYTAILLKNYDDVIVEYALSGKTPRHLKIFFSGK